MKLLICFLWVSILAHAQIIAVPAYSSERVDALAQAIAHAEGYGKAGALPTRYRNPGDLKGKCWTGHTGKGGHAVFPTDAAGQTALHQQIQKIIAGRSRYYTLDTTIAQMSRRYARNWQPWAKRVSAALGVTPNTKLVWLCNGNVDVPPQFNQEDSQWSLLRSLNQ